MAIPVIAAAGIGMAVEAITGIGKKVTKMVTGSKKRSTSKPKAKAKAKSKTASKRKTSSSVGKKANGTLKKGYKYAKGGRVVKAKG